jgi:DNA-binding response OmpR family regulator
VQPLLLHPDPPPPALVHALDLAGYSWKAVSLGGDAGPATPEGGWSGAIIAVDSDLASALALCRSLRQGDPPVTPVLLLVGAAELRGLGEADEVFDDFCLAPFQPVELEVRLAQVLRRAGRASRPELVEHGGLVLNLETYQAVVAGRPLDLTYMEYELLRFLAARPGKVFTRETLLSRVWGYEYYGGARTVDVHIRRLRAKLGEEHAHLIETVRSVGYRFSASAGR